MLSLVCCVRLRPPWCRPGLVHLLSAYLSISLILASSTASAHHALSSLSFVHHRDLTPRSPPCTYEKRGYIFWGKPTINPIVHRLHRYCRRIPRDIANNKLFYDDFWRWPWSPGQFASQLDDSIDGSGPVVVRNHTHTVAVELQNLLYQVEYFLKHESIEPYLGFLICLPIRS